MTIGENPVWKSHSLHDISTAVMEMEEDPETVSVWPTHMFGSALPTLPLTHNRTWALISVLQGNHITLGGWTKGTSGEPTLPLPTALPLSRITF